MKKLSSLTAIIILLCLGFALCLTACIPFGTISKSKKINIDDMQLVFEDNFDGELDKSVWKTSFEQPIRRGGYWTDEQTFTKDGNLIIRTEYLENGKHGNGWYTGTCLSQSLKEFKYGYFEVSCKAPAAEGLWSAFWLQSNSMANNLYTENGKTGAEIDIMESPYYNDPTLPSDKYRNTTLHTIHVDGYGEQHSSTNSKYMKVQKNMYAEFNTYGLLWTEKEYIFYINGYESWRTSFGVSQVPEFLWLSVEIAGESGSGNPSNPNNQFTWAGEITNNPSSAMPADFVIDYVKVYQYK